MARTIPIGDRVLLALNDGVMHPPASYFDPPSTYDRLVDADGHIDSPVGAFFWPGDTNVLIDAGVGPVDYRGLGLLIGGELPNELRLAGFEPGDVDILALSHLHLDHVGWLASTEGELTFPNATVVIARGDWDHFLVEHPEQLDDHLRFALQALLERGRVELIDGEHDVAPGIKLLPAPGHTPGHSVFALHDHSDRMLLLGDAVFCPLQLSEHDIGVQSDLDPVASRRTRELLARELERHGSLAVGCHFPGLVEGRLLDNHWRPRTALIPPRQ
jgi:glyoxylase-like metal-dependent hydrolase (beta-lactamase superfamily II)